MFDNQQVDREQTYIFLEKYGSKKTWLGAQIGTCSTHLDLWLRGERRLSESKLEKLRQILRQ